MAAASKQHTTGFDYLRVGLAMAVVVVHCLNIGYLEGWVWLWTSWLGPVQLFILPSFFALSGYLVTGSIFRNTLPQFAALRVARIFPALVVEVALCALVLGTVATTLPLREYFSSPELHAYFLNMAGIIHYTLPGVFDGRALNLQLWTIPFELECYVALILLKLAGFVGRRSLFLLTVSVVVLGLTIHAVLGSGYQANWNVPGRMLVIAFLFGCLMYLYRDRIPHSFALFCAASVASYLLLASPDLVFLAAGPLSYVTIYLGLLRPRPIPFGDISYGVYLFHFPIARTLHEASGRQMDWMLLLVLTTVLSGIFATLSWRFVEKPVLDRKRALLKAVDGLSVRWSRKNAEAAADAR